MSHVCTKRRSLEAVEHYAFVRERLRCLGVATADLDDATQDVFEVLVRRIADYDPERPIRAWMAGMARRVARRYRDRGRRSVVPLDERASIERSPEDQAAEAEARALLQRFLDELEHERWTVFVLSEIEGLRGSEIAAELGVNHNTVYARLRSAKQAFERTLQRHRARERRQARALVVWPWRWSFGGKVALVGSLGLGATIVLALGGASCNGGGGGGDDDSLPGDHVAQSRRASHVGVAARPSAPARARVTNDADGRWLSGGSGFSSGTNAEGQRFTLSTEQRYRLDADRLTVELTFIGDEVAIDSASLTLLPDGFELVEGELDWELAIAPDEVATRTTTLRATREGVVQLRIGSREGGSTGSKWFNDGGQLRRCQGDECRAPVATREQLSGERIRVHLHNDCAVARDFVLFAGYPDVLPPDSVPVYSLQPDERRTMEIDAAQSIIARGLDASFSAHIDEDGGRVTFSGSGETCSRISTTSPNLPSGHPAAEPPSL